MSSDEENTTRSKREMALPAKILNISIQVLLLIIVSYIIIRVVDKVGIVLFTFHPMLVSIGYLLLMTNAILSAADNNFLSQSLNYQQRITAHWVLQTCALIIITVAQSCIFLHKNNLGKPHYQTTHALFGVTTYLLTIVTSLGGIFTKYSYQLRNALKPAVLKIGHSFAGLLTYSLAIVTICFGINQFFDGNNDDWIKPLIFVVLGITTIYVLIKSFILFASRVKNISKRSNL